MTRHQVNASQMHLVGEFLRHLAPRCERVIAAAGNTVTICGVGAEPDELVAMVDTAAAMLHAQPNVIQHGTDRVVYQVRGSWGGVDFDIYARFAARPVGVTS